MKPLFVIIILLFFFSCKEEFNKDAILGSWTTVANKKNTITGIIDSIVFARHDSLKIYFVTKGVIADSNLEKFQIHDRQLIIKAEDSTFRFEIIELNRRKLVTRQVGKKLMLRYYRLN